MKVLDFGLATRLESEEISELTLSYDSLESKLVGTLPYIAPDALHKESKKRGKCTRSQQSSSNAGLKLYEYRA